MTRHALLCALLVVLLALGGCATGSFNEFAYRFGQSFQKHDCVLDAAASPSFPAGGIRHVRCRAGLNDRAVSYEEYEAVRQQTLERLQQR